MLHMQVMKINNKKLLSCYEDRKRIFMEFPKKTEKRQLKFQKYEPRHLPARQS